MLYGGGGAGGNPREFVFQTGAPIRTVGEIGSNAGTHSGPDSLLVAWYTKKPYLGYGYPQSPNIPFQILSSALQYARPQAIVQNVGPWQDNAGATTNAALVAAVNEPVRNDATYAQSPLGPTSSQVLEYLLDAVNAPSVAVSGNNYVVSYAYYKNLSGGTVDLVVSLMQGASTIASWTHNNIGTIVEADQSLTQGQVNTITDWANLSIRFAPNQTA